MSLVSCVVQFADDRRPTITFELLPRPCRTVQCYACPDSMPLMFLSIVVSLLPARWRGHWLGDGNIDIRRGAILSASVQIVVFLGSIWALYPAFIRQRLAEADALARSHYGNDSLMRANAAFAGGTFAAIEYIFRPLTLLLFYFALEGAVRLFAAVASNEVLPTLPLQAIAWTAEYANYRYEERKLGPRMTDVVLPGDATCDLRIESTHPKAWNGLLTISYNDDLYEVASQKSGPPPRPFVYLLRKRPPAKLIRGLHRYEPEETVQRSGWHDPAPTLH